MTRLLSALNIDGYILLLVTMVVLASLLPVHGVSATIALGIADIAIFMLFFLHGARLSRQAVVDGARHWRLHAAVGLMTYAVFPALGLAIRALPFIEPAIGNGILFLTLLPSTVQSSIAFTSIARGNVAAAVCSASFSNFAGIFLTPMLVALLITGKQGGLSTDAVVGVAVQLLLPFITGHLLRPWIGDWIGRQKKMLTLVDRGAILLVVYTAFSAAVVRGLWLAVSAEDLAIIAMASTMLLTIVLLFSYFLGRRLGLDLADRIVLQFCGSKKSLASGVPMAGVLFSTAQVGTIILPLMVYHQVQLMVCATLARRYALSDEA